MFILEEFNWREPCAYIPDKTAYQEYKVIFEMSPLTYQRYLSRGYRRFGNVFFRPVYCPNCKSCLPYRVLVQKFNPRKDMRRCRKRLSHLECRVNKPSFSQEKFALYERYHKFQEKNVGWIDEEVDEDAYCSFLTPFSGSLEFTYYDQDRLVGLGFVDEVPHGASSLYFVYEPEYREYGIGMYSILNEIEWARARQKEYLYLGYQVFECRSMNYKARYRPGEFLPRFPLEGEEASWCSDEGWLEASSVR